MLPGTTSPWAACTTGGQLYFRWTIGRGRSAWLDQWFLSKGGASWTDLRTSWSRRHKQRYFPQDALRLAQQTCTLVFLHLCCIVFHMRYTTRCIVAELLEWQMIRLIHIWAKSCEDSLLACIQEATVGHLEQPSALHKQWTVAVVSYLVC